MSCPATPSFCSARRVARSRPEPAAGEESEGLLVDHEGHPLRVAPVAALEHVAEAIKYRSFRPGAAPLTSTYALNAATAPYVYALANKGADAALAADKGFALGLNVKAGKITHPAVAEALNPPCGPVL